MPFKFSFSPEPDNTSILLDFRHMNYTDEELRKMTNYKGIIPLIVETAEKKGMRFAISDFPDGEIECLNQDVVIFRGKAGEFIDRLFHSKERSLPGDVV